jgi:hypothetical protein
LILHLRQKNIQRHPRLLAREILREPPTGNDSKNNASSPQTPSSNTPVDPNPAPKNAAARDGGEGAAW